MPVGDLGGGGSDAVDDVAELGFAGGVAEQQAEAVGVGGGGAEQRGDAVLGVVVGIDGAGQGPDYRSSLFKSPFTRLLNLVEGCHGAGERHGAAGAHRGRG
jgi:hypothetical protein